MKISQDEFLSKIDYFVKLEESKEDWCAAFHKESFTLRTRTSQRVERMNRSLKAKIFSKLTLNELFVRILTLHNEITNHDIEETEMGQIYTGINLFANCLILNIIEGKVSSYAYNLTILNLGKSLGWKTIQTPQVYSVYQDKECKITVKKIKPALLECSCYFSASMGMPCEHILACLVHSQDTETNRKFMDNFLGMFAERWKKIDVKIEDNFLDFVKSFPFQVEFSEVQVKPLEERRRESKANDSEEQDKITINLSECSSNREPWESLQKNRIQKDFLENPSEVKTSGRPASIKKTPSYFEKGKNLKRKAEERVTHERTKHLKLFARMSFSPLK